MGKRTSTTWNKGSSWQYGKTTVIRVPEVLRDQILGYARAVDGNIFIGTNIASNRGDVFFEQQVVLVALAQYIEWKRQNYHPNQNASHLDTSTRAWDELRKFKRLIENQPELLLNLCLTKEHPHA